MKITFEELHLDPGVLGMGPIRMPMWMGKSLCSAGGWLSSQGARLKHLMSILLIVCASFFYCRTNSPPTYHVKRGLGGRFLISLKFKGTQTI